MSGVWGPRVRNPNPRSRLNHLTVALSQSLSETTTGVQGGAAIRRQRAGHLISFLQCCVRAGEPPREGSHDYYDTDAKARAIAHGLIQG